MTNAQRVMVEVIVDAGIEEAWNAFIIPESITKWNFASDDWICPKATTDFEEGGLFIYRMESKDGKYGFDFGGKFEKIEMYKKIEYVIGDGRKVLVNFEKVGKKTKVSEEFEIEKMNSAETQKNGWQAILENYKKYLEEAIH